MLNYIILKFDIMENALLKKEDEFYQENEKIEKQTKELLLKVNDVMKIQDHLIKDSINARLSANNTKNINNRNLKTVTDQSIMDYIEVPASVEEMGKDAVTQFYKAKMKSMVVEKEKINYERKNHGEELKKLQKENAQLAEEKEKWFLSYNASRNSNGKLEAQIVSLGSKLEAKQNENVSTKKEIEQLKKELKNSNLNLNNTEVRLNRANEEIEKLKNNAKAYATEVKDIRENNKKQVTELTLTIKHLEKQKSELLCGFKKQLQLIDILKKIKTNLETKQLAETAEKEYIKLLESNIQ